MTIDLQHLEDEGAECALYGPQMPLGAANASSASTSAPTPQNGLQGRDSE